MLGQKQGNYADFQQAYISFTQGFQLMRIGNYNDAITHFDQTIDIMPSVPAYQCRSLCKVMIYNKMSTDVRKVLKEEILSDIQKSFNLASEIL